ncbi:MAG: RNA-directed DNA polymerase [Limnohabitans sp.]
MLRDLFEHIRATGDYPVQFQTTVVSPVFKRKGDPALHGNYRGIAVGGALAKCYATLLLNRLVKVGEDLKLRHPSQAGFRRKMGTAHQQFVMQHLIAVHQRPGSRPLIVVQIDFEKAFDCVPREILFLRLQERGCSEQMLEAIMCAYDRVWMRVKVNGKLSEAFASATGVKQGDPLSTELFGLFIEALADYIDWRDLRYGEHVCDAPWISGKMLSLLLFADDLNLLAESPRRMRVLLEAVDYFCMAFGMRANVKKCETLVFGPRGCSATQQCKLGCATLMLGRQRIPMVDTARYLGLVYGTDRPFDACRKQLVDSGRRAMFGLIGKLRKLKMAAPDVWLRCFDTHVGSILSFGCEVWGPSALTVMMKGGRSDAGNLARGWFEGCLVDPAVKLQIAYMRTVAGALRPAHRLLFAELSAMPMHFAWAQRVVKFWNRIASQEETPAHLTLRAEIELACEGWQNGWAARVLRVLSELGINVWDGLPPEVDDAEGKAKWLLNRRLDVARMSGAFRERLMLAWAHPRLLALPGAFPSDGNQPGVMMSRYKHWMGLACEGAAPKLWLPHIQVYIPESRHKLLMRFRMCCWPLRVNRSHGVPREQRLCPICKGAVEDEEHVLMHCPAYGEVRAAASLPSVDSMLSLMKGCEQDKLAKLLSEIWCIRNSRVRFTR